MTAYIGCVIGILAGDSSAARPWILAFTAGNFLYIAMADLIPELNGGSSHYHSHSHNHSHLPPMPSASTQECNEKADKHHEQEQEEHEHGISDMVTANIGILTGVLIMWAIAVWGE
jgi:hypothetical protein